MITQIRIENYRIFNTFACDFSENVKTCIFVGANGVGKLTLLEAYLKKE